MFSIKKIVTFLARRMYFKALILSATSSGLTSFGKEDAISNTFFPSIKLKSLMISFNFSCKSFATSFLDVELRNRIEKAPFPQSVSNKACYIFPKRSALSGTTVKLTTRIFRDFFFLMPKLTEEEPCSSSFSSGSPSHSSPAPSAAGSPFCR